MSVVTRSRASPRLAWKLDMHLRRAIRLMALILQLLRQMAVRLRIVLVPMAVEMCLGSVKPQAIPLLVRLQLSIGLVVQSLMVFVSWYPARGMAASGAAALISSWLVKSVKV